MSPAGGAPSQWSVAPSPRCHAPGGRPPSICSRTPYVTTTGGPGVCHTGAPVSPQEFPLLKAMTGRVGRSQAECLREFLRRGRPAFNAAVDRGPGRQPLGASAGTRHPPKFPGRTESLRICAWHEGTLAGSSSRCPRLWERRAMAEVMAGWRLAPLAGRASWPRTERHAVPHSCTARGLAEGPRLLR